MFVNIIISYFSYFAIFNVAYFLSNFQFCHSSSFYSQMINNISQIILTESDVKIDHCVEL
jgi:hypothetical protein